MTTNNKTDDYVNGLLSKYDIDGYRELFAGPYYAKQTAPKDFDHLINPFKTKIDVKRMPTDLHRVAVSEAADLVSAVPEHLVQYLVFHHPKPKEQLSSAAMIAKYNEPIKKTGSKKRSSAGDAQPTKRPRIDKSKPVDTMSSVFVDEIQYKAPENLHSALTDLFNIFWELDIEPHISTPFFALLTRHNCGPVFGMENYFDKVTDACTLANIKEKLEARKYSTASAFEFDFKLMCDNVFLYYPPDSSEYKKALELKEMFLDASADMRAKLR